MWRETKARACPKSFVLIERLEEENERGYNFSFVNGP